MSVNEFKSNRTFYFITLDQAEVVSLFNRLMCPLYKVQQAVENTV